MPRLLIYGNSTAEGTGDTEAGGWPSRLAGLCMAKALAEPDSPRVRVTNLANHAHNLADVIQDLPGDIQWARRKSLGRVFCAMQVGGPRLPADELQGQLSEMTDRCRGITDGPPILINLQPHSLWVHPDASTETWLLERAERSIVAGAFAAVHGLPFVDLKPSFEAHANSKPVDGFYDADGVHPGPLGHSIIAKAVQLKVDYLTEVYPTAVRWSDQPS